MWVEGERFSANASVSDFKVMFDLDLIGSLELNLAVFAPDGCEEFATIEFPPITILQHPPISPIFEATLGLNIPLSMYVETSDTEFVFGSQFDLERFKIEREYSYLDDDSESDVVAVTAHPRELKGDGSWMAVILYAALQPVISMQVTDAVVATAQTDMFIYGEFNASRFEPLETEELNNNSWVQLGKCDVPHILQYDIYSGLEDTHGTVNIDFPATTFDQEMALDLSGYDVLYPVISGCVSAAYEMEINITFNKDQLDISAFIEEAERVFDDYFHEGMFSITSTNGSPSGEASGVLKVQVSKQLAESFKKDYLEDYVKGRLSQTIYMVNQCPGPYHGENCDELCTAENCISGKAICNSMTGIVAYCEECEGGYDGENCTISSTGFSWPIFKTS